jgi:hypothetical protein
LGQRFENPGGGTAWRARVPTFQFPGKSVRLLLLTGE